MPNFPWYEEIKDDDSLEQGDLFIAYPIFQPEIDSDAIAEIGAGARPDIPLDSFTADVIVLSQSCDLEHDKVETVILCPVWSLQDFETHLGTGKEQTKNKEAIRKGNRPQWHMLNSDERIERDISIVEFTRIYTTPKQVLAAVARSQDRRIRLLQPYREHLSQAFARYFMRVGLPSDIEKFG